MSFQRQQVTQIPDAALAKWGSEALREGFVPFPKKLLRCLAEIMNDPAYQKLQVILAMVDYLRPELRNPPSLDYLAFIAGLEPEIFRERMNQLVNEGLIDVTGREETLMIGIPGLKAAIEREAAKKK